MAGSKRLIVGLGNPGPDYKGSRHNIGFTVLDRVAERIRTSFDDGGLVHKTLVRVKSGGLYVTATGRHRGHPITLAKPMTFMNRSGPAVLRLRNRLGIENQDLLVVLDDIYLDLGMLRLRSGGGSGGHNGLQDIIDALDSDNFPRMRIGVGSTFSRGRQAEFVLAPFEDDEKSLVDETVNAACDAALTFVTEGIVTAMNRYNKRTSTE